MKKLIKMSVLFVLALTAFSNIKAQMIPCIPPLDPPCTPPCMEITIENFLPCDLDFYWGYSCNGITGAKKFFGNNGGCTPTNPPPIPDPCKMYGQCAKCGDQGTCECPDKLFILDQSGNNFMPWGTISDILSNGDIVINIPSNENTICAGCGTLVITITLGPPGSNSAKN